MNHHPEINSKDFANDVIEFLNHIEDVFDILENNQPIKMDELVSTKLWNKLSYNASVLAGRFEPEDVK